VGTVGPRHNRPDCGDRRESDLRGIFLGRFLVGRRPINALRSNHVDLHPLGGGDVNARTDEILYLRHVGGRDPVARPDLRRRRARPAEQAQHRYRKGHTLQSHRHNNLHGAHPVPGAGRDRRGEAKLYRHPTPRVNRELHSTGRDRTLRRLGRWVQHFLRERGRVFSSCPTGSARRNRNRNHHGEGLQV